jgi:hypothetical protein
VWLLVRSPSDPIQGLVVGLIAMMLSVRSGSVVLPIAARLGCLVLATLA